jgi:hypothetical protein
MFISINKRRRVIAVSLVWIFLAQIISPSAYALTSGPAQPEFQAFQPAGVSDMVDLFSGDFSYNIPLFELPGPNGGYPFNLSYQAGIGMDQEASWVGLGWALHPGAINRQLRGLPDEFDGDLVKTKMDIDPNVTVGVGAGVKLEILGREKPVDVNVKVGRSVYQNSYNGYGYSIDASLGFEKITGERTTGLGLGIQLDSQNGISISPSLSLGVNIGEIGLSASYNSVQGMHTISITETIRSSQRNKNPEVTSNKYSSSMSSSSPLSVGHPGYFPQIAMPMVNSNLTVDVSVGFSFATVYGGPYVNGTYNVQKLKHAGKVTPAKGYGYLNFQNGEEHDLLDINREKDGFVGKETPNLAIPNLTYDIYSVTGQGIGMMFRPMRNDFGVVYDQFKESTSKSLGVGADFGPKASHTGVNLKVHNAKSKSGKWKENNEVIETSQFNPREKNSPYEPWYFKVHGEMAGEKANHLDEIGGLDPVRVKLAGLPTNETKALSILEKENVNGGQFAVSNKNKSERPMRTNLILPIKNNELVSTSNSELIPIFKVKYLEGGVLKTFNRNIPDRGHHFAGYIAQNADGMRYIYGIPAYNLLHEEVNFSGLKSSADPTKVNVGDVNNPDPFYKVEGTSKFYKKYEMPPYAHSYLLTAIVGPDYVDLTNDGVTEDDLGYWVKFTYEKKAGSGNPYKWRDPFSKAHFQEGWKTDPRGDKGSFTYGEKEIWYLAKAETKTHVAEFEMEERFDARGAKQRLQDSNLLGDVPMYKLVAIKLFTRAGWPANPIKTCRFEYDYSLCRKAPNNIKTGVAGETNTGKLTLKKLWFEYGASQRGKLNPYLFAYNNEEPNSPFTYNVNAYDRWGNYQPHPVGKPFFNHEFPYTEQDPLKKNQINSRAAAWSLKEIRLPSGGNIQVQYETDDYAYVQNKQAMQMNFLVDPYSELNGSAPAAKYNFDPENSKIRFKLKRPIPETISSAQQKEEVLKYLDKETRQLYFKIRVNLKGIGGEYYENVAGYADIDFEGEMGLEKQSSSGGYVFGYFHLVKERVKLDQYPNKVPIHPMVLRAWQHIKVNQPYLSNKEGKLDPNATDQQKIAKVKSIGNVFTDIIRLYQGYYTYAYRNKWGIEIDGANSVIRLNSPDKIKYGGGLRVKQITMKDNWVDDDDGVYGLVYDYTTTDEEGNIISSGVAANEPVHGGDENALRYAKKYVERVPLRSNNNLFFEYPVNESVFPGPSVGYSKVTVMSLPSAALAGKITNAVFPKGSGVNYGTSGKTEYEFFTAKDFPVIVDETSKTDRRNRFVAGVPFLGRVYNDYYTASQGYSVITNDMHGKQKKVSNYRQDRAGKFAPEPDTWVAYNYLKDDIVHNGKRVSRPSNAFVLNTDGTLSPEIFQQGNHSTSEKYHLGQEVEFFHDMREFEDKTWGGGVGINLDIVYVFFVIPLPSVWPNVNKTNKRLRTSVTNKMIFRAGILHSIEAFDGGSLVKTAHKKWDRLTGTPVLSEVNNNFDEPVYSYSIPAYKEYQGMGPAYRNLGLTFSLDLVQKLPYKPEYRFNTVLEDGLLYAGDEILLYARNSGFKNPIAKVIYLGKLEGEDRFHSSTHISGFEFDGTIVRSGYRNLLSVSSGSITSLQDPTLPGTEKSYTKTFTLPK